MIKEAPAPPPGGGEGGQWHEDPGQFENLCLEVHFDDQKVLLLEGTVHPILKRVNSKFGHYKVNFCGSSHIKCYKMLLVPLVHVTLQHHVWLAISFHCSNNNQM